VTKDIHSQNTHAHVTRRVAIVILPASKPKSTTSDDQRFKSTAKLCS